MGTVPAQGARLVSRSESVRDDAFPVPLELILKTPESDDQQTIRHDETRTDTHFRYVGEKFSPLANRRNTFSVPDCKPTAQQRLTDVNLLYDIFVLRVTFLVEAEQWDGSLTRFMCQ